MLLVLLCVYTLSDAFDIGATKPNDTALQQFVSCVFLTKT